MYSVRVILTFGFMRMVVMRKKVRIISEETFGIRYLLTTPARNIEIMRFWNTKELSFWPFSYTGFNKTCVYPVLFTLSPWSTSCTKS